MNSLVNNSLRTLAALCLVLVTDRALATEAWSDPALPVRDGLHLWLDVSRQRAAYRERAHRPLFAGSLVPALLDGSGKRRDFQQLTREFMPRFAASGSAAWIQLDGRDDCLLARQPGLQFTNLTVFIVAAPGTNSGGFQCLLGGAQIGQNDYSTGFNIDLGPGASRGFTVLNVEGAGAGGMANLLREPSRFGVFRLLTVVLGHGPGGVKVFANGKPQGERNRDLAAMRAEDLFLGARFYSNEADPPHTRGFFGGDIAELLLYDRALSGAERERIEAYLRDKHSALLTGTPAGVAGAFNPLEPVSQPPPVQMFRPGFVVRELPVALPNLNAVKYRPDGKLVALGYDGRVHLLSDSDGDGLEDRIAPFWDRDSLRAPIGMALTPPGYAAGQGVFVAAKGKLSLIVDTDGDDRADREIVVADGWKELSHGVDALGVAVAPDGWIYFGLGAADFTNPYQIDPATGRSGFNLASERGTILKVAPDFKSREIVCTGIRFPVALAFNSENDLFCTDQEGATWLPNGNPLDELLHIQPGRHYGFPPRHPTRLPQVIDEPSTYDFGPQHQSVCGVNFNPAPGAGRIFGPNNWAGDAFLAGYSRGKLYKTKLLKTAVGYVADSQLIACLNMLTVDVCVSPRGELVVAAHSGQPDWGSGPAGIGKLIQIRYEQTDWPQPALVWAESPTATRIAFDRPLSVEQAKDLIHEAALAAGRYLVAGERFESLRPGYQVVHDQLIAPRRHVPILSVQWTADRRSLTVQHPPRTHSLQYAITLGSFTSTSATSQSHILSQQPKIDLAHALSGVEASWQSASGSDQWAGWLPHFDLQAARALTAPSADHESLWKRLATPGTLALRARLDLANMLRPEVQPGSKLDYESPPEEVTLNFAAAAELAVETPAGKITSESDAAGRHTVRIRAQGRPHEWLPVELTLRTGSNPELPGLSLHWHTSEDGRPRPLQLHRLLLPWAQPETEQPPPTTNPLPRELAEADWLEGRRLFFSQTAACSQCHRIRGEGHAVGPDLSNLTHRDYQSVRKDLIEPNAAINPDHVSYDVELNDGERYSGVLREETPQRIALAQAGGSLLRLDKARVKTIRASSLSLMPEGLHDVLGEQGLRHLLKFLLVSPLEPAALATETAPARPHREIERLLAELPAPAGDPRPLRILLASGPKDHGPDEHDYPLWQQRWSTLLALAPGVTVSTTSGWPGADALQGCDVAVFYSNNPGWSQTGAAELQRFQERGGGLVYVHFAVDGHNAVQALSDRIGLAWQSGHSKFRHGPLELTLDPDHPITRGLGRLKLHDESYWELRGDPRSIAVLGEGVEAGQPRPLIWTRENGRGRVFVSIPGHFTWTFDDPLFRLLLLRGICWVAHEPENRLAELAPIGARMDVAEPAPPQR